MSFTLESPHELVHSNCEIPVSNKREEKRHITSEIFSFLTWAKGMISPLSSQLNNFVLPFPFIERRRTIKIGILQQKNRELSWTESKLKSNYSIEL